MNSRKVRQTRTKNTKFLQIINELYFLMGCVFLIAGTVQGLFGMGLPAIGITLLSVFIPPLPAIGLNIIPILLISLFQIFQTKNPFTIVIQYKLFAASMVIIGFFTSFLVIFLGDAFLLTILTIINLPTSVMFRRDLDTAVNRTIVAKLKLGMFDPPGAVPWSRLNMTEVGRLIIVNNS